MLSAGMLTAFASSIAFRRRGFDSADPPPSRADIVISRISFVNRRPRFASAAPFLCLIVLHLLWPDIDAPRKISLADRADYIARTRARNAASHERRQRQKPRIRWLFCVRCRIIEQLSPRQLTIQMAKKERLIEYEQRDRPRIRSLLDAPDFEVTETHDGEEGLAAFEADRFDA